MKFMWKIFTGKRFYDHGGQNHETGCIVNTMMLLFLSLCPHQELTGEILSYDTDGQLSQVQYENGLTITYRYDDFANLASRIVTEFQPKPRISVVGDDVIIQFEKPLNGSYIIEESLNLIEWQAIHSSSGTGAEQYSVPADILNDARFFRVTFNF